MREELTIYMPWMLSVITIYMTVLAGNKTRWAWALGLCNQALWLVWICASQSWGLLPMNLALWAVYGRNHLKWMSSTPLEDNTTTPKKRGPAKAKPGRRG